HPPHGIDVTGGPHSRGTRTAFGPSAFSRTRVFCATAFDGRGTAIIPPPLDQRRVRELQALDPFEESARHHFAGELHEAKAAKHAGPAEGRELVFQYLAKEHAVALEELPDPVTGNLLLVQRVALLSPPRHAK